MLYVQYWLILIDQRVNTRAYNNTIIFLSILMLYFLTDLNIIELNIWKKNENVDFLQYALFVCFFAYKRFYRTKIMWYFLILLQVLKW